MASVLELITEDKLRSLSPKQQRQQYADYFAASIANSAASPSLAIRYRQYCRDVARVATLSAGTTARIEKHTRAMYAAAKRLGRIVDGPKAKKPT